MTTDVTILSRLRGIQPRTEECRGPYISQDRGMDAICCSRCHVLRKQIYKEEGSTIVNQIAFDYLKLLEERYGSMVGGVFSSCIVSMCEASWPFIHLPDSKVGLTSENIIPFIRKQMLLWREMGIRSPENIPQANIGYTRIGVPIIVPGNSSFIRAPSDSDAGIIKAGEFITIIDEGKAKESGKWMHVINCEKILKILFPWRESPEQLEIF